MPPRPFLFPPVPEDRLHWHAVTGPLPIGYQVGDRCDAASSSTARAALMEWPDSTGVRLGLLIKIGLPSHSSRVATRIAEIVTRAKK